MKLGPVHFDRGIWDDAEPFLKEYGKGKCVEGKFTRYHYKTETESHGSCPGKTKMKITYDKCGENRPILKKSEIELAFSRIEKIEGASIRSVHFGCNKMTTQEGRIVQRGNHYDIRINHPIINGTSKYWGKIKGQDEVISKCGGVIERNSETIIWTTDGARRYHMFLILHEVAHVVFAQQFSSGKISGKTTPREESWCDQYALATLKKIWPLTP